MEITGKIIAVLPEVSGTSRSGNPWKKREYVLENVEGQFPRKVAFTCFGDNADRIKLEMNQNVRVYFDIESREYNGRWYTDIRAWRVDHLDSAAPQAPAPAAAPATQAPAAPDVKPASDDDLFPF